MLVVHFRCCTFLLVIINILQKCIIRFPLVSWIILKKHVLNGWCFMQIINFCFGIALPLKRDFPKKSPKTRDYWHNPTPPQSLSRLFKVDRAQN